MARHERDDDCTLDGDDCCVTCGVYHGDPCGECGGCGFHRRGCSESDAPAITFFYGKTFDGHPWVLSFEGGPSATQPEQRCRVSGRVGPDLRVRGIDAHGGSELRALLPGLDLGEVSKALWTIQLRRQR